MPRFVGSAAGEAARCPQSSRSARVAASSCAFGPNQLDATFGPQAAFVSAPPRANTGPCEGYQFFGEIAIAGETRALTARLRDIDGKVLYEVELQADAVPSAP